MAMTIEPCPFCGNRDVEIHHGASNITFLLCGDDVGRGGCGAVVSFRPNLKGSAAVHYYNRRAHLSQPALAVDVDSLYEVIRGFGYTTRGQSDEIAEAVFEHITTRALAGEKAEGWRVPDELAALYTAASKGFHISESCGPDKKYWHVSKFQSLAELHAFEDAWRRAMLSVSKEAQK